MKVIDAEKFIGYLAPREFSAAPWVTFSWLMEAVKYSVCDIDVVSKQNEENQVNSDLVRLGDKFTDEDGVVWELIENPISNKCVLINEHGYTVTLLATVESLPLPAARIFRRPELWKAVR